MLLPFVLGWLLPIAAIISPASLSVVFDKVHPSPVLPVAVPQPAFDSMAFTLFNVIPRDLGSQGWGREGPTNEVSRVAHAVAAGGDILSINSPGANATWELELSSLRFVCKYSEGETNTMLHSLGDSTLTRHVLSETLLTSLASAFRY